MEEGRRDEEHGEFRENSKKQYKWWFESHSNAPPPSPWLQSSLSELDEKTQVMLRMIDEDADTFGERAEMYYERRPLLVSMVEDFYRAQRSLAEQLDHLHSRRQPDKMAYDSDDSTRSEVDDFLAFEREETREETAEIARLKEENLVKDEAIEELRRKLCEASNEVEKYKNEAESLGKENVETYALCQEDERERQIMRGRMKEEREMMNAENATLNMKVDEMKKIVEMKDEEKREAIRQLSVAVYMLKAENAHLKKRVSGKFQMLSGVGKLFNHF